MAREPIIYLLRSIVDCFINAYHGESLWERITDARNVIICWWYKV